MKEAILNELNKTTTENGMVAFKSTKNPVLDLFATIGGMRHSDEESIISLLEDAYKANPRLTCKIIFYTRDIRGGLGERKIFRTCMNWIIENDEKVAKQLIPIISEYGRWDDLYIFNNTSLDNEMWDYLKHIFAEDLAQMAHGRKDVTLLAKWLKTPDASSKTTRRLGIETAIKMRKDHSVYKFKRDLKALRKYIDICERHMSLNEWDEINYENLPSRAHLVHSNAFRMHDGDRYDEYIKSVNDGKAKMNSSTLYPYDIVKPFIQNLYMRGHNAKVNIEALNAMWENLPNYATDSNLLIVADVSGSMTVNNFFPISVSVSLAMYYADKNTGIFNNIFMTFSEHPEFVKIKGDTLAKKVKNIINASWGFNTDIEAVFKKLLKLALENEISEEDMPKQIVIISDMQFDQAAGNFDVSFLEDIDKMYDEYGYERPNIIFWNANSSKVAFHALEDAKGIQLLSGASASAFKLLVDSLNMTPLEMMMKALSAERYDLVDKALDKAGFIKTGDLFQNINKSFIGDH